MQVEEVGAHCAAGRGGQEAQGRKGGAGRGEKHSCIGLVTAVGASTAAVTPTAAAAKNRTICVHMYVYAICYRGDINQ
jgi:hypothetical protein